MLLFKWNRKLYHRALNSDNNNTIFEPRHDKTNNVSVRPAKTQLSLGIRPVWSESSLFAWRNLEPLATHWAHSEDWSDWANAQGDLRLRWAHSHIVRFVMSQLILQTSSAAMASALCIKAAVKKLVYSDLQLTREFP